MLLTQLRKNIMKVTLKKSQRSAWDATMREEVGMTNIPGQSPLKKHTTRSAKERISTSQRKNVHGGVRDLEYKRLARLERLELTNSWDPLERFDTGDDGGDSDDDEKKKRPRRSLAAKKHIFLSDVLLNEGKCDFVSATAKKSKFPPPFRICDATGKVGNYHDPLTGLYFHDRRALSLLREQTPGWLKQTAISPYWDAIQSFETEGD